MTSTKFTMIVASLAVAAVVLGGCASMPEPPAKPIYDSAVVPGVRIGPAALGMTEANMLQWLGEPSKTNSYGNRDNQYIYADRGLWIGFEGGRAEGIAASQSRYATSDGISVGASELKLRTTWGQPKSRMQRGDYHVQYCFSNGIRASVELQSRRVTELSIWVKGC